MQALSQGQLAVGHQTDGRTRRVDGERADVRVELERDRTETSSQIIRESVLNSPSHSVPPMMRSSWITGTVKVVRLAGELLWVSAQFMESSLESQSPVVS